MSARRPTETRTEHDSMGEVQVPARRAVAGPDPAGGRELPDQRHRRSSRALIHALALRQGGRRPGQRRARRPRRRRRPRRSRAAAARGRRRASTTTQFPIDVFQTGSGTSSNMNMNEVLASLAVAGRRRGPPQRPRQRQPVQQRHLPDRDPRRRRPLGRRRRPAARRSTTSRRRWRPRPRSSPTLVKSGRTHLMDATPVMLGQEFGGYAATCGCGVERLEAVLPRVARAAAGRHRRRHRHQHPDRLRRPRVIEELSRADRPAVHRGPQPLRGPGRPRLAGRAVAACCAPIAVGAHQDLQRPALDVVGPDAPAWPRSTCPTCSRGRASCPARSTRCCPRRR